MTINVKRATGFTFTRPSAEDFSIVRALPAVVHIEREGCITEATMRSAAAFGQLCSATPVITRRTKTIEMPSALGVIGEHIGS